MGPSQVAEKGGKADIVVKSENEVLAEGQGGKELMCRNSFDENMFFVEASSQTVKKDDVVDQDQEIDVLNWVSGVGVEPLKNEDPDGTECSSSFGDTLSGSDCESKRDFSDMEADSPFAPVSMEPVVIDDFGSSFRKKKVTAHWRKFICPVMWRCQWLELRFRELLSQASGYDKEIAAYEHEKELQTKMVELDSSVSKLVPLASHGHQKELMKRRKRKRFEEDVDISSYMSNHVVFSYYENKRTETDGHSVDNDCNDDDLKGNEDSEWLLGLKGSDSTVEQILLNIDSIQSRVAKLKSHLNKAILRNAQEISSPGNLIPGDPPGRSNQSVSGSPRKNGDAVLTGMPNSPPLHLSEDVGMPESAVSSFGDAADPDIISSTFGLLSSLDGNFNHPLSKDADEDVLINNQVVKVEYQNYEKVSHATAKLPDLVKKEIETHSGDESSAPKETIREPGIESEKPQSSTLKGCYSGKRRGRKPKRKWQSVAATTSTNTTKSEKLKIAVSAVNLKSERLKLTGSSTISKKVTRKKITGSGTLVGERVKVGSTVSTWRSERIRKQRLLGKRK